MPYEVPSKDSWWFTCTVRLLMRKAAHIEGTVDKMKGHKTIGVIGTAAHEHRDCKRR